MESAELLMLPYTDLGSQQSVSASGQSLPLSPANKHSSNPTPLFCLGVSLWQ